MSKLLFAKSTGAGRTQAAHCSSAWTLQLEQGKVDLASPGKSKAHCVGGELRHCKSEAWDRLPALHRASLRAQASWLTAWQTPWIRLPKIETTQLVAALETQLFIL